jgi:hypothetical protein
MPRTTSPFRFDDSPLAISPAFLAEIPAGIKTKAALLDELYQRLRFPDYFGDNWDALEECIRDLSWLPAGPVVLTHHDLPLAGDITGQKTYLSILSDAIEKKWTVPGQRLPDLVVVFPSETRDQITWLRATERDEDQ